MTLIEIIVVVVLLAMLMVLAATRIDAVFPRYRLRSAAREVGYMLAMARAAATHSGQDAYVVYDLSGSRIRVMAVPEEEEGGDEEASALSFERRLSEYQMIFDRELPDEVFFRNVIRGSRERVESGTVTVRVSARWMGEHHIINLRDEGEGVFAIKYNGFTGVTTYAEEEMTADDLRTQED